MTNLNIIETGANYISLRMGYFEAMKEKNYCMFFIKAVYSSLQKNFAFVSDIFFSKNIGITYLKKFALLNLIR